MVEAGGQALFTATLDELHTRRAACASPRRPVPSCAGYGVGLCAGSVRAGMRWPCRSLRPPAKTAAFGRQAEWGGRPGLAVFSSLIAAVQAQGDRVLPVALEESDQRAQKIAVSDQCSGGLARASRGAARHEREEGDGSVGDGEPQRKVRGRPGDFAGSHPCYDVVHGTFVIEERRLIKRAVADATRERFELFRIAA